MIAAINWSTAYPIIPHPGELIAGLVVFSALMWVFYAKVSPRLESAYQARREAIEGGLEKAEKAQAEANAERQRYRLQLDEAQGEANTIRERARAEGASIISEMRTQAQEEAARITTAGQSQLAAERRSAQAQLRAEIGGLATELASRIVGESLQDEARRTRVVERFLDELDETPADREPAGA